MLIFNILVSVNICTGSPDAVHVPKKKKVAMVNDNTDDTMTEAATMALKRAEATAERKKEKQKPVDWKSMTNSHRIALVRKRYNLSYFYECIK